MHGCTATTTALTPVKVIAVTGGKGGIGKTNVSINLAAALSDLHKKVLLFDADLSLSNVNVLLGLNSDKNISHVLDGSMQLSDILINGPLGMKVIPASSGITRMADLSLPEHAGLIRAFSELTQSLDVMIVDTAAGISNQVTSFTRATQDILVVVCNEPASITDAYALIKILSRDHGIERFRILANMVHSSSEGVQLFTKLKKTADLFLDATLHYMGSIPYDENVRKAALKQQSIIETYPSSPAAIAFRNLAIKICALPLPEKAQGHITFFLERFINQSPLDMEMAV